MSIFSFRDFNSFNSLLNERVFIMKDFGIQLASYPVVNTPQSSGSLPKRSEIKDRSYSLNGAVLQLMDNFRDITDGRIITRQELKDYENRYCQKAVKHEDKCEGKGTFAHQKAFTARIADFEPLTKKKVFSALSSACPASNDWTDKENPGITVQDLQTVLTDPQYHQIVQAYEPPMAERCTEQGKQMYEAGINALCQAIGTRKPSYRHLNTSAQDNF